MLELESFYPAKERFGLAMQINNLIAAPGFRLWMEGEPLDVKSFLYGPNGKPRLSIFSIAHLGDAERMFFVSLLLNHVVGWMRTLPGTTSLRAIIYVDEVFGFFPPVANPPSKLPMLTLMKQARAFGVGVMLVTQNPVDLDYKGLSNTGTWFIGRLQTDRDKIRVLDALEGASAGSGKQMDRGQMDQVIAGLGNRVFLMHNVHDDAPTVFTSRWAMSYLCGPLTREQIKLLMDPIKARTTLPAAPIAPSSPVPAVVVAGAARAHRPVLPAEIPQYFLPSASAAPVTYRPMVLGVSQVHFADAKRSVDQTQERNFLAPLTNDPVPLNWDQSFPADVDVTKLAQSPLDGALFADLPSAATSQRSYATWQRDFGNWLARSQRMELLHSPSLGLFSRAGEGERDFRIRLQQAAREAQDLELEKLRKKYAPKYAALDGRIHKAQVELDNDKDAARRQSYTAAASTGSSIFGTVIGSKAKSRQNKAHRENEKKAKLKGEVRVSEADLNELMLQRKRLEEEFQAEVRALAPKVDPSFEKLETYLVKPTKTNISVRLVSLVWRPEP